MSLVLVVDDSPNLAHAVATLTHAIAGCEVIEANDGETALALVRERQLDLIVLDYHMPGMSGIDVLRQLRKDGGSDAPPVIMCTADQSVREEAIRLGAVAVVPKGEAYDLLLPAIRQYARC